MSKKMTRLTTTLIACAFLFFALTSVAEAGASDARASRAEAPVSLVDLAGDWFASLWTGMTQIFEKDGSLTPGPTTSACTNPNSCGDAGWVIDPNG
jgi:ABC-type sugar transport system substrate-binding protein